MDASGDFGFNRPRAAALTLPGRKLVQDRIDRHVANLRTVGTPATGSPVNAASLQERLFDASAAFKVFTSLVAMHLDDEWRKRLFRTLDSLLDPEEWDEADLPPALVSFQTLMRMLLILKPARRPALGIDNGGNLIASWTTGDDRLTVTCLPGDRVVWVLKRHINGEVVRTAGESKIGLMPKLLAPYSPSVWFDNAK